MANSATLPDPTKAAKRTPAPMPRDEQDGPEAAPATAPTALAIPTDRVAASALAKIAAARAEFEKALVEREAELNLVLTAMVAGENCLLIGPPGTAKSMLCDDVSELIGGEKFGVLLNRFTSPEEIFGPPSLKALEAGEYVRLIDGYLPTATVAFLDEIFKASSAILNTMLKILNEGTYKNGKVTSDCPLEFAMAASNEVPGGDNASELTALFDRFVLRKMVRPVVTPAGKDRLMFGDLTRNPVTPLTTEELAAARSAARKLSFSEDAKKSMVVIVRELQKAGINPGDRRLRKSVGVAQAAAWLDGSADVQPEHLMILQHVLWDDATEQPKKAAEIVMKACNPDGAAVAEMTIAAQNIVDKTDTSKTENLIKAARELADIITRLKKVKSPSAKIALEKVEQERNKLTMMACDSN